MASNLQNMNLGEFIIAQEAMGGHKFNHIDKQASSWENGSSRLWSLFDMLQRNANDFIEIGRSMQSIVGHIATIVAPNDKLNDSELLTIQANLVKMAANAVLLQIDVSYNLIKETYDKYELSAPTWSEIGKEIEFISRTINAELKTKIMFFILPHRETYYSGRDLLSEETLDKFPSAKWDMEEAGKCFATERFTAAVHHLMRVAEYGLISFAEYCKVDNKDRANWNRALSEIEKAIREKNHPNYITNMTKEDEQYYTEAAAWLRNIKTAWRNPVSHIPTVYDEPKALELFGAIKNLMNHLSKRFKEVPMVCSP